MDTAQKKEVRILHCGDLHLDSPFSRLSPQQSEQRREDLRACFREMTRYVRENGVDLVLMSGDLFDSEYATSVTVDLLIREFEASGNCHFVISPGNHDPRSPGSIYLSGRFGPNVHIFEDEILTRIDFDDLGTAVYGWAFTSPQHRFSPLAKKRATPGFLNLLCGHCDLDDPLSVYCPVMLRDVQLFGADYAGFSHRHVTDGFHTVGRTVYAYSGCLENRSYDEPGIGGANLVLAVPEGEGWKISAKRLIFGRHRYRTEHLDVTGIQTPEEAETALRERIASLQADDKTLLRVIYEGAVAPALVMPCAFTAEMFGLYALEIRDYTTPTFGAEALQKDMSARGELYRTLLPRLSEGTPEERARAAAALRVGLAALEGRDITRL